MAEQDSTVSPDEILAIIRSDPDAMAAVKAMRDGDRDELRRALGVLVDRVTGPDA